MSLTTRVILADFGSPVLLLLGACLGPDPGQGEKAERGYRRAAPVIAAIEAYHRDNKR